MHCHAYARAQARARARAERGTPGNCRGAGKHSQELARAFVFAFLALYFAVFSAFVSFLDKFISRAAFFENRR